MFIVFLQRLKTFETLKSLIFIVFCYSQRELLRTFEKISKLLRFAKSECVASARRRLPRRKKTLIFTMNIATFENF